MVGPLTKSWVWVSTEISRAEGKISVLAVTETLICVAIYWLLMLALGVTWHHWMILIATPLVLLRSEQSISEGAWRFAQYMNIGSENDEQVELAPVFAAGGLAGATTGLLSFFFSETMVAGSSGWGLFGMSVLNGLLSSVLGLVVAVAAVPAAWSSAVGGFFGAVLALLIAAIAGPDPAMHMASILGAILGIWLGLPSGIWLRATLTRFVATVRHIEPGLRQFSRNWRSSVLVSDVLHPPELIPGFLRPDFGSYFFLSLSRKYRLWPYATSSLIVFYLSAMIWRWSIKSTAWFYFPLIFVQRGWLRLEGEELRVWALSYSSKVWNWLWMILGALSYAALAVGLFSFEKWQEFKQATTAVGSPMPVLAFLLSLNWVDMLKLPWLWFYIPSYALAVIVYFALDGIAKEIRVGASLESRSAQMVIWKRAANVSAVLTNVGLGLALLYFLSAVGAMEQVRDLFARLL